MPREAFEAKALFQMKFYALVLWRTRGVVATQLKLIYLGDGDALTYAPDEDELVRFERTLLAIWAAIERAVGTGDFRPNTSRLCGWCDHQALCPAFGGTPPPFPAEAAAAAGWPIAARRRARLTGARGQPFARTSATSALAARGPDRARSSGRATTSVCLSSGELRTRSSHSPTGRPYFFSIEGEVGRWLLSAPPSAVPDADRPVRRRSAGPDGPPSSDEMAGDDQSHRAADSAGTRPASTSASSGSPMPSSDADLHEPGRRRTGCSPARRAPRRPRPGRR